MFLVQYIQIYKGIEVLEAIGPKKYAVSADALDIEPSLFIATDYNISATFLHFFHAKPLGSYSSETKSSTAYLYY